MDGQKEKKQESAVRKKGQTEERMNRRRKEWVERRTEKDTKGQTKGRRDGWK